MSLLNLTFEAAKEVSTYRSPDLSAWRAAIDPVLIAAGLTTIGSDCVEDIEIGEDTLYIRTSYSVRCCAQTNDIRIPVFILETNNPVQAATLYRLGNELKDARSRLASAQRNVVEYSEKVAVLEASVGEIKQLGHRLDTLKGDLS